MPRAHPQVLVLVGAALLAAFDRCADRPQRLYTTTDFGRSWRGPTADVPAPPFIADRLVVDSAAELRARLGP